MKCFAFSSYAAILSLLAGREPRASLVGTVVRRHSSNILQHSVYLKTSAECKYLSNIVICSLKVYALK